MNSDGDFLRIPQSLHSTHLSGSWRRVVCYQPNISVLAACRRRLLDTMDWLVRFTRISQAPFEDMLVSTAFRSRSGNLLENVFRCPCASAARGGHFLQPSACFTSLKGACRAHVGCGE